MNPIIVDDDTQAASDFVLLENARNDRRILAEFAATIFCAAFAVATLTWLGVRLLGVA